MHCPRCSRTLPESAWLCEACEYIVDTSFLGDDILNQEEPDDFTDPAEVCTRVPDAVILGDPRQPFMPFMVSAEDAFLVEPTLAANRMVLAGAMYLSSGMQDMLQQDTVLQLAAGVDPARLQLSAFEAHVISQIDGHRPLARIAVKSGVGWDDLRIAVATLIDKKIVTMVGVARPASYVSGVFDAVRPTQEEGRSAAVEVAAQAAVAEVSAAPVERTVRTPPPPSPAAPEGGGWGLEDQRAIALAKAEEAFQLAKAARLAGRMSQAWIMAKMAADYAPEESRYKQLLEEWSAERFQSGVFEKKSEDLLFFKAQRAEQGGDYKRACQLLKRAIQINPDNAALHNHLGVVLSTRLKLFDEASAALMRAVELDSENMNYRANLMKVIPHAKGAKSGGLSRLAEKLKTSRGG